MSGFSIRFEERKCHSMLSAVNVVSLCNYADGGSHSSKCAEIISTLFSLIGQQKIVEMSTVLERYNCRFL